MKKNWTLFGVLLLLLAVTVPVQAAVQKVAVVQATGSPNTAATAPVQYLIDDNPETAWGAGAATNGPLWAELRLNRAALIDGLHIYGTYTGNLNIEYWQDGGWRRFIAVRDRKAGVTSPGWNLIDLSYDRIVTNRIRLWITAAAPEILGGIGEVKILGRTASDLFQRLEPVTIGTHHRTEGEHGAENLFDHNTYTTWWAKSGTPFDTETVADLGETCTIRRIKVFGGYTSENDRKRYDDDNDQDKFQDQDKGKGKDHHKDKDNDKDKDYGRFTIQYLSNKHWIDIPGMRNLAVSQPGNTWKSFELATPVTTDKIRIVLSGYHRIGGLGEIEIWGEKTSLSGSRYLFAGQAPFALSLTNSANYCFNITKPVWGTVYFHLAGNGTPQGPLSWELNGSNMGELQISSVQNGRSFYLAPVAPEALWNGPNFVRINGTGLVIDDCRIEMTVENQLNPLSNTALGDRWLWTPTPGGEKIIDLQGLYHIDELLVNYENIRPNLQLAVDFDGQWTNITTAPEMETGAVGGTLTYSGIGPARRIKILFMAPGDPAEIVVHGSLINDGPPRVRITAPMDGDCLDLKEWVKEKLTGAVDNPETELTVNGRRFDLNGTHFSIPLTQLGLRSNESKEITVIATDRAGRTGTDRITIHIGLPPGFSLNLPDRIIYTQDAQITVSGQVLLSTSKVWVNGIAVPVVNRGFSTAVKLQEGLNPITVKVTPLENGKISNIKQRWVVKNSAAPYLKVLSPVNGEITKEEMITVSGEAASLAAPVRVTVNGKAATVDSGFFTSPLILKEGNNPLTIIATDGNGVTTKAELVVKRDGAAPVLGEIEPADGACRNTLTIHVKGTVTDSSPAVVLVNGKAASVTNGRFEVDLPVHEGQNSLKIEAFDAAGNTRSLTSGVFIDTKLPAEFTPVADPSGWTNNNKPAITFSTSDEGSGIDHFVMRLNDGPWSVVASPYQFTTPIPDGEHTVTVKAVDKAWNERPGTVKVYIDTTPPVVPTFLRVIPGNGRIVVKWNEDSTDVVEYRIERDPVPEPAIIPTTGMEYIDPGLENGATYKYRVWAIDRARNQSEPTEWKKAMVGLAEAEYVPNEGAIVEYDGVTLVMPKIGLPEDVAKFEVTEVRSQHLEEKAVYPILGPIYEFSAYKAGENEPLESCAMEEGYLGSIQFDPDQVPEGFPEQNLGVYYYEPMFDRWFLVDVAGVDPKNHTIYFMTNHFSSFSVQASLIQDLSPQEYKDSGYSPLKSYSEHSGIMVSPQGGTASTRVTELVLPGRDGFDLEISRRYDTATARNDAFSLAINGRLGMNLTSPAGADGFKLLKNFNEIMETAHTLQSAGNFIEDNIRNILEQYLFNQGDYAYSMGQGWRLNLPYMKAANRALMLCDADGAIHSINEMSIVGVPVSMPNYRKVTFKQREGDDFTLTVEQVSAPFDVLGLISGDETKIFKSRWYSIGYELRMKDGATYKLDALGRTTKIVDPSGKNTIDVSYEGLFLDHITDTMGRRVKFGYQMTFLLPRIDKIWVENDSYHREINYSVGADALLDSARDAGGRVAHYDYDTRLLVAGEAGFKVNILTILVKIVGGPFVALAGSIFGADDIELFGRFQAQLVFPIEEVVAPGQGKITISYDQPTFMYGNVTIDYFKLLFIKIPISITFSINMEQRLLADKVNVYLYSGGPLIKSTRFDYDINTGTHGQPYVTKTVENDGKKKIIYNYQSFAKERHRWEDHSVPIGEFPEGTSSPFQVWFPLSVYSVHMLTVNKSTEIRDAQTGALFESNEMEYDLDTMRPTARTTRRGSSYRTVSYSYDNWGNVTYIRDYSFSNGRANQIKTWMYYLMTNSAPSSAAPWLGSPFTQAGLTRKRNNLLAGKIVANHTPVKGGGETVTYLHSYSQYNELGQQIRSARWNGSEWLITQYDYHSEFGGISRQVNPEGHVTVYEYDTHGLPSAVIEKSVGNAAGETADIITKTGHEFISGWKLWQQDARGFVTEYRYDTLGRTTRITVPDDDDQTGWIPSGAPPAFRLNNPVTTITYNDQALYSIVTDPHGHQTKYDFDGLGQLTQLVKYHRENGADKPAITDLQYDNWGNIIAITDPNGHTTSYRYDTMGRNTAIIYPDDEGRTAIKRMEFDYSSNIMTIIDENGYTGYEYQDIDGRVYKKVQYYESLPVITEHYFDGLGNEVITIDPKGSVTTRTYNQLGQLARIDLPTEYFYENGIRAAITPYQRFGYNKAGFKNAEIRPLAGTGTEITNRIEVDALGRAIRTITPYTDKGASREAITEIYYDGNGNKVKVIDPNNTPLPQDRQKVSTYQYSGANLLLAETDPAGNKTTYTYDKAGNRTSLTDPRGNSGRYAGDFTIVYHYDDLNRLVKGLLPAAPGQATKPEVRLAYDLRGNLLERVEPDEAKTVYTYTARNQVATETATGSGASYKIEHHYDLAGNEIETIDSRGHKTVKEYNELNRVETIIYPEPEGKVGETFHYDVNGNRTKYINGNSVLTQYAYDVYNHLIEVRDGNNGITSYHYDRWGNLTQMINALGHTTKYDYDELSRLLREKDPQGYVKEYGYDAAGNRIRSVDPNGTTIGYEYTPNNLVSQVTLQNGDTTQVMNYLYDEAGFRTWVKSGPVITEYNTGSNGGYTPDPFGRIHSESKIFDDRRFTAGYDYDVMGRMTRITYPTGQTVDYQYNNLGQLQKVPGYVDETPVYDQGGLLKSLKAANGVAAGFAYDQNGRLTNLSYESQSGVLKNYALHYDGANNITQRNEDKFQYDFLNQLLYTNLKGNFEIDPEEEVQKIGKIPDDFKGQKSFEFELEELDVIELDYAAGSIGVDLIEPVKITRVELQPNNPLHRVSMANQIRIYMSQDNVAYTRLQDWKMMAREKGGLEIVFDTPVAARFLKIKSMFDERNEKFKPVNLAQFKNTPLDLIHVYYLMDTRREDYTYDKIGNRKTETVTQRYPVNRTYTYYENSSRVKSNGKYNFEYDPNGNLIRKETLTGEKVIWKYQYDLLNRLCKVEKNDQVAAEYTYDEAGLRIKKQRPDSAVYYMFDTGGNVLYEQENKEYLEYIYVLGKHFARIDGNLDNGIEKKYFYHTDHLGSTVAVTDEAGKQVWSAEFTPFGKQVSKEGELDHVTIFTGKDLDEDTGLYYFNARWMDPETGRFTTEDTNPGDPNDPRSLNYYTYCYNNPVLYSDPDGHVPIIPLLVKAGAGGAADLMAQATMNYFFNPETQGNVGASFGDVNWWQVGRSSAEGLIPWKVPGGRFGKAAATAVGDVLVNALYAGTDYSAEQALQDFAVGFIGDLAGGGVADLFSKYGSRAVLKGLMRMGFDSKAVANVIGLGDFVKKIDDINIGPYKKVKGHHIHAKAAFKGHVSYDPQKGLSISQELMETLNWDHDAMTQTQRQLFKDLAQSGAENTLEAHSLIAIKSLMDGGASELEATYLVEMSLKNLTEQGVDSPTHIPWKK